MLGTYASTIGITLLTNKRAASNAASPEMANMKGKRFVVFQEPENTGSSKDLWGKRLSFDRRRKKVCKSTVIEG